MSPSPKDDYRPASTLAVWASILFVAQALIDSVSALFNAYHVQLLEAVAFGIAIPPGVVEAQDLRQRVLAGIGLAVGLTAEIFLLIWVYRASRNAHTLGAERMQYSPGWSVGWFLVPVAGLYMPYFVVKELWKASSPSRTKEWRDAAVLPVLGVWWAVSLISAVIQYSRWPVLLGDRTLAYFGFDTPLYRYLAGTYREFFFGLLIGDVVEIAVCVLTVVVVVSITNLQGQRAARQDRDADLENSGESAEIRDQPELCKG
jgi:hypothetical protein